MRVKKQSAWRFNTSASGSLGVSFVAGGAGAIYLKDPKGNDVTLAYAAAGVGKGIGIKTKGTSVSGNFAPAQAPNVGTVLIMDSFDGDELSRGDLDGLCAIGEVSGSIFVGGSATVMLLGLTLDESFWDVALDVYLLGMGPIGATIATVRTLSDFQANAMVVLAGVNVGAGAGGDALVGYAW